MVSRRERTTASQGRSDPYAAAGSPAADQPSSVSSTVGELPGSPSYFGTADVDAAALEGPSGLDIDPGDPPGSAAYLGAGTGQTAPNQEDLPPPIVGEPPGSASYYGASAVVGDADTDTALADLDDPDVSPGEPPGSASYLGLDDMSQPAALSQQSGLPLPTIGEAPGGSGYFGSVEAVGELPGSGTYHGVAPAWAGYRADSR